MKTKRVPSTTNNLTHAVINFLNNRGHFAFRVNSAGVYDPIRQSFRRKREEDKGISDIIACMRYRLDVSTVVHGYFLGIEIKNAETKDRIRPEQKRFRDKVVKSGGNVLVIKSYEEFTNWYGQSVFK